MHLRKYVRQVRPIQEHNIKPENHIQRISEAYDIFPKSSGEIDTLDISHDKEKLKSLLNFVLTKSGGMPDPIAISNNPKEKGVKIHRVIADDLNLPDITKKFGIKVSAGNGSRGGTGTKSMGFGFEAQVTKDIETFIQEGIDSPNFTYPEFMKELNDSILSKHSDIQVKQDGGANTRRPLVFTDIGALIKGRDLQIGNLITDVTVSGDGEPYYLSLKFGGTVTFFNAGVQTIFTEEQFKAGRFKDKRAKQILGMFGINEKKFIDIFEKYDKKNARKIVPKISEDVTRKVNLRALLQLLVTGIGYGYYMVHKKGKKVEFYEMTRRRMMDSAKVKKVTVLYPKPGSAKRIDIEVVTKLYIFKINIRNKQGKLYPSHIMCDNKPNPDAVK